MKNVTLTVAGNTKVSNDIYIMRLLGDCSDIKNPGEFIEIALPGYYLRRPISVCDFDKDHVDILYKVLGHGTKDMTFYERGMKLDVIIGLGNGFNTAKAEKPLLVAGGIGVAPMFGLLRKFNEMGIRPVLVYGAGRKSDIVLIDELASMCELHLATDDGSLGFKGNSVELIKSLNLDFDYYYSCGPMPMLKALANNYQNGCLSLEARMGCGFGACMGCSIKTTNGFKRVCKEGPVFEAKEVIF